MTRPPPLPPRPPKPLRPPVATFAGEEPPTGRSNANARVFAAVASAFDHLSSQERTDLAEIACLYADLLPEERRRLLRVCRALAGE